MKECLRDSAAGYGHRRLPRWSLVLLILCSLPLSATGQDYAGLQELFVLGAGARAIGLGGAMVAMPVDATSLYWNPGGLDVLERKNLVLFYTPLLGGTKYNFIGYAHPTLQLGTFGVGMLHYDVGDVRIRNSESVELGTGTWSEYQFLISYAKELPMRLSVGGSIKIHRQAFSDYDPTAGFGTDIGMLYRPDFGEGMLQDLSFGFSVQNLVAPRLKLDSGADILPRILRAGFAKPIILGERADAINLFFTMQASADVKSRWQFGSEYVYQNRAMLRFGMNGSGMSFGGGVVYEIFQFDYAMGQYSSDANGEFAPQHRVGITIQLGKSKAEQIQLAEQRRQEEVTRRLEKEMMVQRRAEFNGYMEKGKTYFQQNEFFNAYVSFGKARDIFPSDEEAQVWQRKAQAKNDEETERQEEELRKMLAAQAAQRADSLFIANQFAKGKSYFDAGDYDSALREWQTGLERDPGNTQIKSWMEKTRGEMGNRITDLRRRAESLEIQGKLTDAIQAYNRLLGEGGLSESQRNQTSDKIAQLQKKLSVNELLTQGVAAYLRRDYRAALGYFEEGKKVDPGNALIRKYWEDSEARLNAKVEEFKSETIRQQFIEAVRLSQNGKHDAALKILEQIQKEQRYNKRILEAIDQARERLDRGNGQRG